MQNNWHAMEVGEVIKLLGSAEDGLRNGQIKEKSDQYGLNELPSNGLRSGWVILFNQMKSSLIIILFILTLLELVFGKFTDAIFIFIAVLINVVVGYLQESKAENTLKAIKGLVNYQAKVKRDGRLLVIDTINLVPGDIVALEAGDRVPADGRLMSVNNLSANESQLTGESLPITKRIETIDEATEMADRKNMVFQGSLISSGHGEYVVTAIGLETELGKISTLVKEAEDDLTPLQFRLKKFSRFLSLAIILIMVVVVVAGLIRGIPPLEIITLAVALGVAAIPEGLLISITVVLAIGMRRILKHNALVRRLSATETLGSTDVICTDKTGTLTLGQMKVVQIIHSDGKVYDLQKSEISDLPLDLGDELKNILRIGAICNTVERRRIESEKKNVLVGDSTEVAIIEAYEKSDGSLENLRKGFFQLDIIPFDHTAKMMTSLVEYSDGARFVMVKGSPEKILSLCSKYIFLGQKNSIDKYKKNLIEQVESLTMHGLRLLAVAYLPVSKEISTLENFELKNLIFSGIVAMSDPLRKESAKTIELATKAGIRTVIISGDHALTVTNIAKELGMTVRHDNILEGEEIDAMSDAQLDKLINNIIIFARVSPKHKIRIVNSWQRQGAVVAMIGDGVNDAPALKAANVGVALGSGTDVAKEASDLVLLDDNFKTLVMAIKQGRVIFENIRKVFVYLLSTSFTEVVLVVGSIMIGLPLPLTALQILYINLVTDTLPNIALTLEGAESGIMQQKPRGKMDILDGTMKKLIFIIGISTDLVLLAIYFAMINNGWEAQMANTFIFMSLGLTSLFFALSCKNLHRAIYKINLFDNPYLVAAILTGVIIQFVAYLFEPLKNILGLVNLDGVGWLIILGAIIMKLTIIELGKYFLIRRNNHELA